MIAHVKKNYPSKISTELLGGREVYNFERFVCQAFNALVLQFHFSTLMKKYPFFSTKEKIIYKNRQIAISFVLLLWTTLYVSISIMIWFLSTTTPPPTPSPPFTHTRICNQASISWSYYLISCEGNKWSYFWQEYRKEKTRNSIFALILKKCAIKYYLLFLSLFPRTAVYLIKIPVKQ